MKKSFHDYTMKRTFFQRLCIIIFSLNLILLFNLKDVHSDPPPSKIPRLMNFQGRLMVFRIYERDQSPFTKT